MVGIPKRESVYDKYIGKCVIISPYSGPTAGGLVKEIKDGHFVLNPFQGGEYTSDGTVERKMIHKDAIVNTIHIYMIEPTTLQSLENCCKFFNKKADSKPNQQKPPQ